MTTGSPNPFPTAAAPAARGVSPGLLALLVVLLLLAAVAAWTQVRAGQRALQAAVTRQLAAAGAASAHSAGQLADNAAALREAQARIALLEAHLAESQSQQAVLENFYRDLSPSQDDLALSEAEQTINLAAQQLALAGNVQSALTALQFADARLARVDRPRLTPLRRALASDMDRLKAVPYVDVPTLAARIDSIIAAVDTLPQARDERLADVAPNVDNAARGTLRTVLSSAWTRLHDVIRIESTEQPAAPLLTPSQEYFMRENLRLRLLSARSALLARNDASFKSDVRAAAAWTRKYFDMRARSVQAVAAALAQLAAVPTPQALPDFVQTLGALAALRAPLDRGAMRAPEKASAATGRSR